MWKLYLENCFLERKLGHQLKIILVTEGGNCIKKKKFLGMEIGSATEHRSGSRGAYVETVFIELFSGTEIGLVTKHHSGGTG